MGAIMNIQQNDYPVAISKQLVAIIDHEIEASNVDTSDGVILNFRDPDYSAESGGYHPVEICVNAQGRIQYITDFAYFGQGPYAELDKELDFDFSYGRFQQMGREYPIKQGASLFKIWQSNFCSYYRSQVFSITVQPM
jgi:hypothetical protein